jgi:hypothetical protein
MHLAEVFRANTDDNDREGHILSQVDFIDGRVHIVDRPVSEDYKNVVFLTKMK